MDVTVTGAAGFLGVHLVRTLRARGDRVRCLVRRANDAGALADAGAEVLEGDVTKPDTLPRAVDGADVVFHLAGVRRAPVRSTFMHVNAEGTRRVCEAMVAGGAKRLVFAGSLAATGPSLPGQPKREEDPFEPREWYGESKAEGERIAFSFGDRLEVTSVRPVRIIGPGDRENLPFFRIVAKGLKLDVTGPRRPISFVDVDDVVAHCLLLAERKEAVGEAFFSVGEELSLAEMQDVLAEVLGVSVRRIPVPPPLLRALATAADGVSTVTGKKLPLNRKLARQLLAPAWSCSPEKSARLLGFRAKKSIRASIAESARWYRDQGWL